MADMKILDGSVRVRADEVPDKYPKNKIKNDRDRTPGAAPAAAVASAIRKLQADADKTPADDANKTDAGSGKAPADTTK